MCPSGASNVAARIRPSSSRKSAASSSETGSGATARSYPLVLDASPATQLKMACSCRFRQRSKIVGLVYVPVSVQKGAKPRVIPGHLRNRQTGMMSEDRHEQCRPRSFATDDKKWRCRAAHLKTKLASVTGGIRRRLRISTGIVE
jgi:hypothetical protein